MKLTKDEKMMELIYGDGTRAGLIQALKNMKSSLQEDEKELQVMTDGFLSKLERMSEEAFREAEEGG